jgi:hypothetical protein
LAGLIALTPAPSGIIDEDENDPRDESDPRALYDEYIRESILSGTARGCTCDYPGCHCDGIADAAVVGEVCGCCLADCPDAHDNVQWREELYARLALERVSEDDPLGRDPPLP